MMWYGVLGTKELLQRTYKNLEQRVQLEVWSWGEQGWGGGAAVQWPPRLSPLLQCDGVPISLPSLQGIAVLNIPSYAGGINFWGGTKEDNVSASTAGWAGGTTSFPQSQGTWDPSGSGLGCPCLGDTGRESWVLKRAHFGVSLVLYRTLGLHPLMTRSWRWWLSLAASRWLYRGSSTSSTIASHR